MSYVVVDVETTGLDPKIEKIVEIACAWRVNGTLISASNFINPQKSIPADVSAITHITDKDVKDAPLVNDIINEKRFPEGIVVAHNAKFDRQFLPQLQNRKWLCTYRCSLHLWPDSPNHKNQTLRYYLGIEPELPEGLTAHRALYDVLVTEAILQEMLKTHSLQDLLVLQDKPVLQKKIKFGKYRGFDWNDVPKDYLSWLLRQDDSGGIDDDIRYTARYYINLDHGN
jgi:exodeoxyribonuclease X